MTTIAIRPFRAADLPALAQLMGQTLGLPEIDEKLLARDFLLASGFQPNHLLVAVRNATPAGFMLAPRNDPWGPKKTAWLAGFGVAAAHRQLGIATALLARLLADLRQEGIDRLDVANVPVRYFFAGVDPETFPIASDWLDRRGFSLRDEVASMGFDFAEPVPDISDPAIRAATPGDYPALKAFLLEDFDASWWAYFERSILATLNGDPTPSETFCAFDGDRIIGTVHYRSTRFGPLAVGAAARGRGLGAALTVEALRAMRAAGMPHAGFRIGRPDVQPFYAKLGFTVLRRFRQLTLSL